MGRTRASGNLVSENILSVDISNDRVGIGSTQPTTTLDVNGTVTASSGSITTLSGTSLNYTGLSTFGTANATSGTITSLSGTSLNYTGVSTFGTATATSGTITSLSGTSLNYTGVSTLSSSGVGTVTVGAGNTALVVQGDARITGILTIGTGSITIDGSTNFLGLGTATPTGDANSLSLFSTASDPPGSSSFRIAGPLHKIIFQGLDVGLLSGTAASGQFGISGGSNSKVVVNNLSIAGVSTFNGGFDLGVTNTVVNTSITLSAGTFTDVWTSTASLNGVFLVHFYIDDSNMPATGSGTWANYAKEISGIGYAVFADKVASVPSTQRVQIYMNSSGVGGSNHSSGLPYSFWVRYSNGGRAAIGVNNPFPDALTFNQTSGREFKIALTRIADAYTG